MLRTHPAPSVAQFEQRASYQTTRTPCGALTALAQSVVAFGTNSSTVEVWDWKTGKQLHSLGGFSSTVLATARLPDGRLLCAGQCGNIRIGFPDKWSAATALTSNTGIHGVLVARDGSFVTADNQGQVRLWRNGTSRLLNIQCYSAYSGTAFAVVGQRLLAAGNSNNIIIAE